MEMPQTEHASSGSLLQEVWKSMARASQSDDRSNELMRLASNPLLLRDFLAREEDTMSPACRIPNAITFWAHALDPSSGPEQSSHMREFEGRDAATELSLRPEVFEASEADRLMALSPADPVLPRRDNLTVWWVVLVALVVMFCLVRLLLI